MDDREKEILRCRRVDRIWSNWLAGFLIYAGIIARAIHGGPPLLYNIWMLYIKLICTFQDLVGYRTMRNFA